VVGSVAHVLRRCDCYERDSRFGDPPVLTKREAAVAVHSLWLQIRDWSATTSGRDQLRCRRKFGRALCTSWRNSSTDAAGWWCNPSRRCVGCAQKQSVQRISAAEYSRKILWGDGAINDGASAGSTAAIKCRPRHHDRRVGQRAN